MVEMTQKRAASKKPTGTPVTDIGVYVNLDKAAARAEASAIVRWLTSRGLEPLFLKEHAHAIGEHGGVEHDTFFDSPELIVSLGGDGTFLHVARHIQALRPALLGVNFGRLGYLTAVEAENLLPFLDRQLTKGLTVERRLRLACRAEGWEHPPLALNDIVIQDADGVRTVRLRVRVGDSTVGIFRADGVIAATPTGSTAYTLSVGGPVVHPRVEALLIALVSPHTLSARPLVFSAEDEIVVEAIEDRPVRVIIDGQETRTLSRPVPIHITRAPADVAVVVDPERTFVNRIREKLSWGGNARA